MSDRTVHVYKYYINLKDGYLWHLAEDQGALLLRYKSIISFDLTVQTIKQPFNNIFLYLFGFCKPNTWIILVYDPRNNTYLCLNFCKIFRLSNQIKCIIFLLLGTISVH